MLSHHRALRFVIAVEEPASPPFAFAQAADPALSVKKVKDNHYVAQGGGGNSSIIIGQNGVIVVDARTTLPAGKRVVDEVGKLTNKPITTVMLTHSDGDGLPAFPRGVTIIAHDKKEIEQARLPERVARCPKSICRTRS